MSAEDRAHRQDLAARTLPQFAHLAAGSVSVPDPNGWTARHAPARQRLSGMA